MGVNSFAAPRARVLEFAASQSAGASRLAQDDRGVTAHFAGGATARGDLLVGMGVTKGAGDALALADCLAESGNDVPSALARYESLRLRFSAAVVAHGRELGAWLQGVNTPEARRHHTPEAVMAEIAVTRDYL